MPPVEEHAPDDGEGAWYSRPQADRIAGRYFDAVTNNSIFMLAYQRFMDKSLLVWSRRINSQAAHCGVIIAAVSRFICKSLRVELREVLSPPTHTSLLERLAIKQRITT